MRNVTRRYVSKETRRGAPLRDRRVEYSEDHRFLLAFCAKKAKSLIRLMHGYDVPIDELMAEGWYYGLRRLKAGDLRKATSNVILIMLRYGRSYRPRWRQMPEAEDDHADRLMCLADPDDVIGRLDAEDEVRVILAGMNRTLRKIGMDYYGKDCTMGEIAERYGRSRTWVAHKLRQFRLTIQGRIGEKSWKKESP